jgi:hypothetical protein
MPDLPDLNGINTDFSQDESVFKMPISEPKKKKKAVSTRKSAACKLLNEKLYQHKLDHATNKRTVVKPSFHENSASMVEKCIVAYCSMMPNGYAWKVQGSGTMRVIKGKKQMTNSGATNGIADVNCVIRGLFLGVEVKFSKGDKQRPAQIKWQQAVERAGGYYVIVSSFTHFLQVFKNWYAEHQNKMI